MIYTSSYKNFNTELLKGVSISGDKGKIVNWNKSYYSKLAPKLTFWQVWKANKGKINDLENNRYYIREFYKLVLSNLDPEIVYKELDNSFLLCYEDSHEFCHRHIVAAWLELFLDIEIKEAKIEGLYIETIEKSNYIKKELENIMKESINMKGFNSLRALYLFEKSNIYDAEADKLEIQNYKNYDNLRQLACNLRCEADMAEDRYNEEQFKLLKKKKNIE